MWKCFIMKKRKKSEESKQLTLDHTEHVMQLVLAVHQGACVRSEAV
jgi:hypothetical protein